MIDNYKSEIASQIRPENCKSSCNYTGDLSDSTLINDFGIAHLILIFSVVQYELMDSIILTLFSNYRFVIVIQSY